MHQPLPHGLLSVGSALTEQDSAALELLARKLTNLRQLSGVDSLRMVRNLPDGGYVIAQNMGGTFRCITHKPLPDAINPDIDGLAHDYIPMLFSGVVTDAIVGANEGVGLKLSEGARRRIANYADEIEVEKEPRLMRFAIPYSEMVYELAPKVETALLNTQYVAQRPTWYSGAMAEVMQIVGGYGRQDLSELPDTPVERARLKIPEKYRARIQRELNNKRLPGYTGFPKKNGQFQYDYKFNNTNGVAFGADGKPWLLRVSPSGVWAMPLPTIPATTTDAFREYMEEVGDEEILSILDRFGGMPSGEGFPASENDVLAWKRAGVAIKLGDAADFYQHNSYSSACGWSFNTKGTEGFNTCYDYVVETGLGYGLSYKLKLSIGEQDDDALAPMDVPNSDSDKAKLNGYVASLYELLKESNHKNLAIKYKLRRVGTDAILSHASRQATQSDVDYWDNLEVDSIATGSASIRETGRGWLFDPAQPEIKFPEPFMDGCVSHVFLPARPEGGENAYHINPNCDTIMFGYYIGDSLKVVKYFRETKVNEPKVDDGFEPCMLTGSFTKTITGPAIFAGRFYTTDFDERKELPSQITTTTISSSPAGVDNPPFFSFDDFFARPGTIWRNHYFLQHTSSHTTEGQTLEVAVCIPYLCRNAVLHGKRTSISGETSSSGSGIVAVPDPISYRYWTNDRIWAWWGGLPNMNQTPYPVDGNPVWVTMEQESSTGCSAEVGSGPWISLPSDYSWLVRPTAAYQFSGGGSPPQIDGTVTASQGDYSEDGEMKVSLMTDPQVVSKGHPPRGAFFAPSPDPYVGIFYTNACKVVFGNSVYGSVYESEKSNSTQRKHWGHSSLADSTAPHHFIGVIHE